MTLEEFIARAKAGQVLRGVGGQLGKSLLDGVGPLNVSDIDAVTAEAYNQGIFPATFGWTQARRRVQEALTP